MKTTLLSSFFLVLSYFTIGQVNFHEIKLGSKYSEQALTEAIEKANWCGYYHEFENYELRFDDGAVVKLKNKMQLSSDYNGETNWRKLFSEMFQKNLRIFIS